MPNLDFKLVIVEYWSVAEENMDRWRYFYNNIFLNCLTHADGYCGTIVQERSDSALRRSSVASPGRVASSRHIHSCSSSACARTR